MRLTIKNSSLYFKHINLKIGYAGEIFLYHNISLTDIKTTLYKPIRITDVVKFKTFIFF